MTEKPAAFAPPTGVFAGDLPAMFGYQMSGYPVVPLVQGRSYLLTSPDLYRDLLLRDEGLSKPEMQRWDQVIRKLPPAGLALLGMASETLAEKHLARIAANCVELVIADARFGTPESEFELRTFWRACVMLMFVRVLLAEDLTDPDPQLFAWVEERDRARTALTRRFWMPLPEGSPTEQEWAAGRDHELRLGREMKEWLREQGRKSDATPDFSESDLDSIVALAGATSQVVTILVSACAVLGLDAHRSDDTAKGAWWQWLMAHYPPPWILGRTLVNECAIGDVNIPAGAQILYSPLCTAYDPRRPTPRGSIAGLSVFGAGKRQCPAKGPAVQVAQAMFTEYRRHFVAPRRATNLIFDTAVSMLPRAGCMSELI